MPIFVTPSSGGGGGGSVDSVTGSNPHVTINNTDPANPVVEYLDAIEITYAALLILKNAGTMKAGWYKITDRADAGIYIKAVDGSNVSPAATGIFYIADFANLPIWDFTNTLSLDVQPIFTLNLSNQSGGIANGDIATGTDTSATAVVVDDSNQNAIIFRATGGNWLTETAVTFNTAVTADVDSTSGYIFALNQQISNLGYITDLGTLGTYANGTIVVSFVQQVGALNVGDTLTVTGGGQMYLAAIGSSHDTAPCVIWNNRHYAPIGSPDLAYDYVFPDVSPNWTLLDKDDATFPMVLVANTISYDIVSDTILTRQNILNANVIQIDKAYCQGSLLDWGNPNSIFDLGVAGYVEAQNCIGTQLLTVNGNGTIVANNNAGSDQVLTATENGTIEANFNLFIAQCIIASGNSSITANNNTGAYQTCKASENSSIQANFNSGVQTLIASGYGSIVVNNNANNQDITAIEEAGIVANNNSGYGQYLRATGYGQIQANDNSGDTQTITVSERGEVNADNNSGSDQNLYADGTSFLTVNNNTSGDQRIRSIGIGSYIEADDNTGDQSFEARNNSTILANTNAGTQLIVSADSSSVTVNANGVAGTQNYIMMAFSNITDNGNILTMNQVKVNDTIII